MRPRPSVWCSTLTDESAVPSFALRTATLAADTSCPAIMRCLCPDALVSTKSAALPQVSPAPGLPRICGYHCSNASSAASAQVVVVIRARWCGIKSGSVAGNSSRVAVIGSLASPYSGARNLPETTTIRCCFSSPTPRAHSESVPLAAEKSRPFAISSGTLTIPERSIVTETEGSELESLKRSSA